MNDITRRAETAQRRAVGQRNYRRARDRALAKLANQYPDTYQELLEQERKADEKEGKVWTSLRGSNPRWITSTSPDNRSQISRRPSNSEDEGDLGGEA